MQAPPPSPQHPCDKPSSLSPAELVQSTLSPLLPQKPCFKVKHGPLLDGQLRQMPWKQVKSCHNRYAPCSAPLPLASWPGHGPRTPRPSVAAEGPLWPATRLAASRLTVQPARRPSEARRTGALGRHRKEDSSSESKSQEHSDCDTSISEVWAQRHSSCGPFATFPVTIWLSMIPKLHTSVAGVEGPSMPSGAV